MRVSLARLALRLECDIIQCFLPQGIVHGAYTAHVR